MFAQLYKFTKNQTAHLQWVKFNVSKLYLNKSEKKCVRLSGKYEH